MANPKDDIKARLMATFRVEAEEHLHALTENLLALEGGPSPDEARAMAEATFREMHTLKGAARSVSLVGIEAVCQAGESVLSRLTRGQLQPSPALLKALHETVAGLGRLLAGGAGPDAARALAGRLERLAAEPRGAHEAKDEAPASAPVVAKLPPAGLAAVDTLRVPTATLDALTLQAEELLAAKLAAGERAREALALAEAVPAPSRTAVTGARELHARLVRDHRALAAMVDGLLEETRRLRLTPVSSVLEVFPRMVRDLAQEQGKEVEWVVTGAELEIDRRVLEAMKDPLIHLVRNAVDHGLEPPQARLAAGKDRRGRVAVAVASLEGGLVEIRVEDDGRGVDLARVKAAAVRAGLLASEAAPALSDGDALELIYRSGLSTSPLITDVSGHGLGLAIVREKAERLGGGIGVETRPGRGTTVRVLAPATVATFRGLLVRAAGRSFLVALEAVERAVRIAREDLETVDGRAAIRWQGRPLWLARLDRLLELKDAEQPPAVDGKMACVVVRSLDERLGLLVDEVVGEREGLVKELRPPLRRVRNVSSAALLGTGEVVLLLRVSDLLRPRTAAARAPAPAPARAREEPRAILVVDDSITTRMMEKNLLEAAGYAVRVAVDGVDAWTALKTGECDLVVSDIDMPRMDGFELTARIRADAKLSELPVVLVTALESREDKERGIEAGANAYVVKSSFDQSNLLEIIRRLL